jgi:predicted GNAT family N-acyltransferase
VIEIAVPASGREIEDAFAVRVAVFVDEQGIPRSEELDDLDATAVHCVAYADGAPVGAGRLLTGDDYAKIGRMAVLKERRGSGVGGMVLEALEREGADRGIRHFRLSAQITARGFYERHGYTAVGDVYDEVDIPHIAMEKRL